MRHYLLLILFILLLSGNFANAGTENKKIALFNIYAGDAWHQAMLESFTKTTNEAIKSGIIAKADVFTVLADKKSEQKAKFRDIIAQGYDAIIIDATAPSFLSKPASLGELVTEACAAHIIIVFFGAIISEPCAWQVVSDFDEIGEKRVEYFRQHFSNHFNFVFVTAPLNDPIAEEIENGSIGGLSRFVHFKPIASVLARQGEGETQKAVSNILTDLPSIDAALVSGDYGYEVAQAFLAAKRPLPIIVMSGNQNELQLWQEQHKLNGYETISISAPPAIVDAAFWLAQHILDGKSADKKRLFIPYLKITSDELDNVLKTIPKGGVASGSFSHKETVEIIDDANSYEKAKCFMTRTFSKTPMRDLYRYCD